MTPREMEKILTADGWKLKNQRGGHKQFIHPTKPGKVTISQHKTPKDLNKKTVNSILTQAGLK